MKTILVPTDFSKCANTAMTYALEIAKRTGAAVEALHVVFPNQGVENNVYNAFWIDDYLEQRRRAMDEWIRKFRKNEAFASVEIRTSTEIGFPVPGVCERAEEVKAELIVMGTTGATGLRGAFLGSTASGVLSKTEVPVFLVPKKGAYRTSANVVFATDFRMHCDERSRSVLRELLTAHGSGLKIVHILDKPGEKPDRTLERQISEKLEGIAHDFHYLHDSDVPQAISDYIEAVEANALVTISHEHTLLHRLFFESITKALAHRIIVPMLVLHDK